MVLTPLPWDSDFFGFKIGRIDGTDVASDLERAKNEGYACLYCLDGTDALEEHGFVKVDEKATFRQTLSEAQPVPYEEATDEDAEEIKTLAGSAFRGLTRFYLDPRFDDERADELYRQWIDKAMENSTILITRKDSAISGFNAISMDGTEGVIELIAVSPDARGAGVGGALVAQALTYFREQGAQTARVATQGTNQGAGNLYTREGFALADTKEIWHWWNDA